VRLAAVGAIAFTAVLAPLTPSAAERSLGTTAAKLPRVERYAQSSASEIVQARYDAARALEDELSGRRPTSRCRASYRALARAIHAHVTATEGIDRLLPARRARDERRVRTARRNLEGALRRCVQGAWGERLAYGESLIEPLDGEAFFGLVRARAPDAAARATVSWNGRVVAQQRIKGRVLKISLDLVRAGPGTAVVRFFGPSGRLLARQRATNVWLLPSSPRAAGARSDPALRSRLATIASGFRGFAGIWIHDLTSGRVGAWNHTARFPAASTVKLGVIIGALDRYGPRPERSGPAYDMAALARWSSNLASNRLLELLGNGDSDAGRAIVESRLRRMGATRSSYPGEYRVGTSRHPLAPGEPPLVSSRTTTARDLGRILASLHAAANGESRGRRQTQLSRHEARVGLAMLLRSLSTGDNVGLFRPALPQGTPAAQKHGWISSARHSAAIVYANRGPVVVVLLTYRESLSLAEAQQLGRRVISVALGAR
jgi:beta-lactamase class A